MNHASHRKPMPALRLGATMVLLALCLAAQARDVPVNDTASLAAAIAGAQAGDRIVLAPGLYTPAGNLNCIANGTAAAPIQVRGAGTGTLIRFSAGVVEGFRVSGAHWQFEDLTVEGACAVDSNCEHAFHLFGNADATVIRRTVLRDFNAQIKSNILAGVGFPDDVLIERNVLHDTRARQTSNPVVKLDVVGGRRWVVRANTFFDFHKALGDGISYAGFLKGNSRDGVLERNLVICERFTSGGTRLGLSLGGGGTAPPSICEDGSCDPEHQDGIVRNNLILDCPDVGLYFNRSARTIVQHNTLFATAGIDVRFPSATADLRNNLLGGPIRFRDGATGSTAGNLTGVAAATFRHWFLDPDAADFTLLDGAALVDQGAPAPAVLDDYCGRARNDGAPDIGALEYDSPMPCRTDIGGGLAMDVFRDGFEG